MIVDLNDEFDFISPLPEEWLILRMRNARDQLLASSDYRMVSDAPWNIEAWGAYRQALRDFPATWTPSDTADFPDPPEAN
jgi:hypothetical protein